MCCCRSEQALDSAHTAMKIYMKGEYENKKLVFQDETRKIDFLLALHSKRVIHGEGALPHDFEYQRFGMRFGRGRGVEEEAAEFGGGSKKDLSALREQENAIEIVKKIGRDRVHGTNDTSALVSLLYPINH